MKEIDLRGLEKKLVKTSFPLELGCTRTLERRKWDVRNNFIFEDPRQQKDRELDIFACDALPIFGDKRCLTVYVFVDCKKSKYPWVFYPSSKRIDNIILGLDEMIFRDGEIKRIHDESDALVSDLRWNSRFKDSRISSWFFESENKKHDVRDAIGKLAKAACYVTIGFREELEPMHPPLLFVVYEAIVLDGLLCSASLQGKRFHLSPTEHIVLGTDFMCPNFRSHMIVDVIQAEYFSKLHSNTALRNRVVLRSFSLSRRIAVSFLGKFD